MNSQTSYIKVLKTSPWVQYHPEDLPARIVMWKPDDTKARQTILTEQQYATHLEVQQEDGTLSFNWGHYDMTYDGACRDFDKRVERLTENRVNIYTDKDLPYFNSHEAYIRMQGEQEGAE